MSESASAHVQVMSRFDELVEEGHAARDALLKIFNKKIKRSKQKDAGTWDQAAPHAILAFYSFLSSCYALNLDVRHTCIPVFLRRGQCLAYVGKNTARVLIFCLKSADAFCQ